MKIGLYFGSFNPIHLGHLIVANHMAEFSDLEEIWLVISPRNPWKEAKDLLAISHRLEMLKLALIGYKKLKVCEIELTLPLPSLTITTLEVLKKKYPKTYFSIIMGSDLLNGFKKWEGYSEILKNHSIYIYPRGELFLDSKLSLEKKFHFIKAPQIEISSTFIRKALAEEKNIRPFLCERVWKYLKKNLLYM